MRGGIKLNIEIANNTLIKIENEIEKVLQEKEQALSKVLPKAKQIYKDVVATSRTERNRFLYFVYAVDKYDKQIDLLSKVKEATIKYIDKELVRLKKYKKIEELIVYYKENKRKKYKWEAISKLVGLCQAQCRNIYKSYKNTRNI